MAAAGGGHATAVRLLLSRGGTIHPASLDRALARAEHAGHVEVGTLLREAGAANQ